MKLIIELDDDIAKGIRGEYDCKIEPREIVRIFQATITEAIAKGKPYEERPHGEWIDTGYMEEYWAEEYHCSICGTRNHWNYYCPNCGADMREVKSEPL